MAAIIRAEIPDEALESQDALACWILTMLDEIYDGQSLVREAPGVSNPVVANGDYRDLDRILRFSSRVNLRLIPGWQADPRPLWEKIIPVAPLEVPPAWKKQ